MYSGVLTDYRQYFMPVRPFTLALRGMHYGRYGRDGEDPRLSPLTSASRDWCAATRRRRSSRASALVSGPMACEAFDRLLAAAWRSSARSCASRCSDCSAATHLLRPVPGRAGAVRRRRCGVDERRQARVCRRRARWARSAGVALRANVLGFAIIEIDYVRPLGSFAKRMAVAVRAHPRLLTLQGLTRVTGATEGYKGYKG